MLVPFTMMGKIGRERVGGKKCLDNHFLATLKSWEQFHRFSKKMMPFI